MAKDCYFCTKNIKQPDYKDAESLRKFTDSEGKIMRQKETGLCVKHQKRLAQSIKRARFLAFLPFTKR